MTMLGMLGYLAAFALALGVLIIAHELGHFLMARWLGVKILRFSVGFGRPLVSWRWGRDQTEWGVAAFPLGGYVKMLDEREGDVPAALRHRAFNRQPVLSRIVIVAAGPMANLLLAILLYWVLFLHGTMELRPVLGAPPPDSPADRAGIVNGMVVRSVDGAPIQTWDQLRIGLVRGMLNGGALVLEVQVPDSDAVEVKHLDLAGVGMPDGEDAFAQQTGLRLFRPDFPPIVGTVVAGSPAEKAGVQSGDRVIEVAGVATSTWEGVVKLIRAHPGEQTPFRVARGGQIMVFPIVIEAIRENGRMIGRVGMGVRPPENMPAMATQVRYGLAQGALKAIDATWDTSYLTLILMGKMVTGDLSWRNLSGPVAIADYAGQSARAGLAPYLKFLALISISLGVLNLLPIPVLDGGHLMYYLAELVKGSPVSERVLEMGQRIGLAVLGLLMAFALYNDINRLISS